MTRLWQKAREHGVYIQSGSMIEHDPRWPDVVFNTTCLIGPEGILPAGHDPSAASYERNVELIRQAKVDQDFDGFSEKDSNRTRVHAHRGRRDAH